MTGRRAGAATILACLLAGGAACDGGARDRPRAPCAPAEAAGALRINQIQVVGSHNSYRRRTYQPLYEFLQRLQSLLPPELDVTALDYDHLPFAAQLEDHELRALELDVFADPAGGLFYDRQGLRFVDMPTASNIPALQEPGFKVLHVPDVDYETNADTFAEALAALETWSDAHPSHLPLFVQLETSETSLARALPDMGLTETVPFDAAAADALDAEVRAVFTDPARIITPDEVRGAHDTLEEAVLAPAGAGAGAGWPTLAAARGRLLFFIEGPGSDDYLAPSPVLAGRLMFVAGQPGQPHAAVVIENLPTGDAEARIRDLVARGYLVRTRADADTVEARSGDTARREAAFASGAQIVSTDYYRPDPRAGQAGWTAYDVYLPGGPPARVNPVSGGGAAGAGAVATPRICE